MSVGDQQSEACSWCVTVVRCISLSVTSGGKLTVICVKEIQNMYNVKITFIMPLRVKIVKTAI